jgi:RNA polymerase sigma-70 factor, ECF subfamily
MKTRATATMDSADLSANNPSRILTLPFQSTFPTQLLAITNLNLSSADKTINHSVLGLAAITTNSLNAVSPVVSPALRLQVPDLTRSHRDRPTQVPEITLFNLFNLSARETTPRQNRRNAPELDNLSLTTYHLKLSCNFAAKRCLTPSNIEMAAERDPDADLMLRVKKGDASAFEELVDKYKQPVLNMVYRTLRDSSDAEDIAQNVFVQVFKSADRYRVEAKFTTWLFTIARNLCLNEIRRRSRHPAESLEAAQNPDDESSSRQFEDRRNTSAPDLLLRDELTHKVEEALASLPENQRTAILLFKEKDMSYEEISKILDCSLSATKSLIHRGRETLKERLKPYLKTGAWDE